MSPANRDLTRREALKKGAAATAALGLFHIVPSHVLGGPGRTPPSETITRGIIGCGSISYSNTHLRSNIMTTTPSILGICDVDSKRLSDAARYVGEGVTTYTDWRDMLDRTDIDVMHICTPPHWHALMSVAAARAGFDIWCEKPMSRTIYEGVRMVEEIERTDIMFRINTWFRFRGGLYGLGADANLIKKLVLSGRLGGPLRVRVSPDTGFPWKMYWTGRTSLQGQPAPEHLDYDSWLGPAPWKPYTTHRTHASFRGYWDYDGGGLADMGQHYLDPVQWFLDKDHTSPTEISASAPWPQHPDACGPWGKVSLKYDDGNEIILESREWGPKDPPGLPYLEGPNGKVFRGMRTEPADLLEGLAELPDPPQAGVTDFDESVKTRQRFALHESNGHRSCTLMNLANIAVRTGRKLRFDPVSQTFPGDDQANRMVRQPMRAPWKI